MRKFPINGARALAPIFCLLCLTAQARAQQPAQTTPQRPDPHGQTHTRPAPSPSTGAGAPQEGHDTGFHPPYYEYPFGSRTPGHRSISVEQAVELALKNASVYRQAQVDERIAREDVRQARAAFLPQFSIPLTYTGTTSSRYRVPDEPLTFSFTSASAINETSAFINASGSADL